MQSNMDKYNNSLVLTQVLLSQVNKPLSTGGTSSFFHTATLYIYTFSEVDDIPSHLPQLPPSASLSLSHTHPIIMCTLKKLEI